MLRPLLLELLVRPVLAKLARFPLDRDAIFYKFGQLALAISLLSLFKSLVSRRSGDFADLQAALPPSASTVHPAQLLRGASRGMRMCSPAAVTASARGLCDSAHTPTREQTSYTRPLPHSHTPFQVPITR